MCVCLCYKMRTVQRAAPVQNFPVGVTELLADAGGRHTVIAELRCQLLHVRVNTSVCHCTHTHRHTRVVVKPPPSKMRRKMHFRRTLTPTLALRGAALLRVYKNSHAKPAHASSWSKLGWKARSVHERIKYMTAVRISVLILHVCKYTSTEEAFSSQG